MLKNMKLGTKIQGGIQIVLLLLAVMAFQGYNGVSRLAESVDKYDDTHRIIKWTLEAQQLQKDFIIRQEDKYTGEIRSKVEEIISLAKDQKSGFQQSHNIRQVDSIIAYAQAYITAFNEYVITKGSPKNNFPFSHPIFGPSLVISHSQNPRNSPAFSGTQSKCPNLTQIWA